MSHGPAQPTGALFGKLRPSDIRTILVGINAQRNSKVRIVVRDLEWCKF